MPWSSSASTSGTSASPSPSSCHPFPHDGPCKGGVVLHWSTQVLSLAYMGHGISSEESIHTHTHTLRRNWAKNIWHTCWIQYSTKINRFRYHKLYHWFLSSFWSQLHSKLIDVFTQTSISPTGLSCPATYPPGPDQAIAAEKKQSQ